MMLVGYAIAVALSRQYEWIAYPYNTLVMGAAILPDLNQIELVLLATTMQSDVGVDNTPLAVEPVTARSRR